MVSFRCAATIPLACVLLTLSVHGQEVPAKRPPTKRRAQATTPARRGKLAAPRPAAGNATGYRRILADYRRAHQERRLNIEKIKRGEKGAKWPFEPSPNPFAQRMIAYAKTNPDQADAFDALAWVIAHVRAGDEITQAGNQLVAQYAGSKRLSQLGRGQAAISPSAEREKMYLTILDRASHPSAKGALCIHLGRMYSYFASYITRVERDPKRYTRYYGKSTIAYLAQRTPKQLKQLADDYFERAITQYGNVDTLLATLRTSAAPQNRALDLLLERHRDDKRVLSALKAFAFRSIATPMAEKTLEKLLAANPDRELRGRVTFSLAKLRKLQADMSERLSASNGRLRDSLVRMYGPKYVSRLEKSDPRKLREKAEKLLQEVVDKYADLRVEIVVRGRKLRREKIGEQACKMLFTLQNLVVGKTAPEIEAEDLAGVSFKLSKYRGKVVLLDFWGHWSAGSRARYALQRSLVQRLADRPFALIGVNSDRDREALAEIVKREQITWHSFWNGPQGPRGPISTRWEVRGWPTQFLLDAQGVIRQRFVGAPSQEKLIDAIESLLKEAESDS